MALFVTLFRRALGVSILGTAAVTYSGEDVIASIHTAPVDVSSTALRPPAPRPVRAPIRTGALGRIDCNAPTTSSRQDAIVRRIGFDTPVSVDDLDRLSTGARTLFSEAQLADEVYGHALSFDVLSRCQKASLLKTPSMIRYRDDTDDATDYLARIQGRAAAVKVVRAPRRLSKQDLGALAQRVNLDATAPEALDRMLGDLQTGRQQAWPIDRWNRQVLFVLTDSNSYATSLTEAWEELPSRARNRTVLWVAVTEGHDDFLYGAPLALN